MVSPNRLDTLAVGVAAVAAFALALFVPMRPTLAQSSNAGQAPLEMTFVDATPQQSAAIHDKLRTIISSSDDINFTDPETFLFSAQKFDVTLDDLGSAQKRSQKRELMRRAMRANNLESVVVYKRTGETLHLIVLGPSGAELKHFRSPVKRSQITDKQAVTVLKRLFQVLVPKVRAFRKKRAKQKEQQTASATQVSPSEKKLDKGNKQTGGATKPGGPLGSNVTLTVSPMAGRRSLTMNSKAQQKILTHVTPFFGGGVKVDSIFGVLSSKSAAIGGSLDVQYGRFSTKFRQIGRTVAGTVLRVGGGFRYLGGLSSDVALFGEIGAQGVDVGLETNSVYVGSSYFGLSAGGGVLSRIGDFARLEVGANAVPTIVTSTNDRAFGSGSFSLGVSADARFTIRALKPVLVSAYYVLDLYQPKHEKPTEYEGPASGTDMFHIGGLAIGYQF